MTDRQPIETTNLDIYGHAALPWSMAWELLKASPTREVTFFLGTAQPDGLPHAAAVAALWHDGDLYFVSGPNTRKSRNIAANPACTFASKMVGLDLILEGESHRVTDQPTLETVAELYRKIGWPIEVKDDAFTAPYNAPSAGRPPYYLYRFIFHVAYGTATVKPDGATRWRFA